MDEKREIRNTQSPVLLVVQDEAEESRKVEGYALLFDTESDGLPFVEVIERGSMDGVVEHSDVFAWINHDSSRGLLARSKNGAGSLSLEVDSKGLKYRFEAPRTPLGDELLENLRRGEISESSFAFTVASDTWEKLENGVWKRTIHNFDQIFDVSPVYNAAYSATSVYTRGRDLAEERLIEERRKELSGYYEKLEESLNL